MTPREGVTSDERPQRVVVIGPSNSGKSTLAQPLARSIDAPFVELDALYWRPNWVGAPDDEFAAAVIEATAGEAWVVAGSYSRVSRPHIWPRAQCVIWIDLPLASPYLGLFTARRSAHGRVSCCVAPTARCSGDS